MNTASTPRHAPADAADGGSFAAAGLDRFVYDDAIVRKFAGATIIWAFVGMLVGIIIAVQMALPPALT